MSSTVTVTLEEFYTLYPEFNIEEYENICPIAFRQAQTWFSINNSCRLKDDKRVLAIYLMTAHLSLLSYRAQTGQSTGGGGGSVASASVGEVSISYVQIPNLDNWSYWLSLTPYGLELLALLETLAFPFYIGGSFERVF